MGYSITSYKYIGNFAITEKSFRFYKVMNDPRSRLYQSLTRGRITLHYVTQTSSNCEKINAISYFTQILLLLLLGVTQAKQIFKNLVAAQNNHGSESKSGVLRRIGNISCNDAV